MGWNPGTEDFFRGRATSRIGPLLVNASALAMDVTRTRRDCPDHRRCNGIGLGVRKDLRDVDSRLRIYDVSVVSDQIDTSLWQTRWEASLLGAFGILALLIASVGLYGVLAFSANRRIRELEFAWRSEHRGAMCSSS